MLKLTATNPRQETGEFSVLFHNVAKKKHEGGI